MRVGEQERRTRDPGERVARTPASEPAPAVAMAAARALSLQAAVGNRAASAVLARQPDLTVLEDEGEKFNPEHIVHTLRRAINSEETRSTAPWWKQAVAPLPTAVLADRVRSVDEATIYRVLDGLTKTQVGTVKRLYAAQSNGRSIEQDLFEGGESNTPSDLKPLQRERIRALLEGTRAEDPLGRPIDAASDARFTADAVELHELATGDMKDAQIERVMQLHRRPVDDITKVDRAYELRYGKHLGTVLNDRLPKFMQNRLYQLRVGNLRLADAIALEHHRQKALLAAGDLDAEGAEAATAAIRTIVEQNRQEALADPANAGVAADEAIKRRLGPLMETQHEGFGTLGAALEDAMGWAGYAAIKAMARGSRPSIVAAEKLNEMELRTRADLPGKTTHMAVAQLLRDLRESARREMYRRATDKDASDELRRAMLKEPEKAIDALAKAYIDEFVETYETIKGEDGRSYEAIMASADQPGEDLMRLLTAGHGRIDPVNELDIAIRKKDVEGVKAVLNAQRTPDAVAALKAAYADKRGEPLEWVLFGRGVEIEGGPLIDPGDPEAAATLGKGATGGLVGGRDAVLADEALTRTLKGGEEEVAWIESHGQAEMRAAKSQAGWTGSFRRVGEDPETEVLMEESADQLSALAKEWREWEKADPWGRRPRHEILADMRRWRATLTGDAAAYEEENARMRAQIRAAVSFAVQVALALALPGVGAGFIATTAMNIAATVATNAVLYGDEYTLKAFRDDLVFGIAGAAGGKLADEAVGIIAGAVAADTAQAAGKATTKAGVTTTLAKEADQAAALAGDASRLAVVGREAANILGGAAAVTAVGGTGQFDPLALGQAALMSIVGRFAPGPRKPGADGDAGGAAVKDAPGGPSSAKPPREILGDASAAEMGHPGAGLRGAEALIRVAEHSGHLPEPAAGTTLESYANQIGVPITAELGRLGAAVPKVVARDLGNPDRYAMMDFASNTITLNTGAMDGQRPLFDMTTAQGRQSILSNVFHEARHAEQLFHALRHRATLPNAGEPLPGIHPAIEAAAERAGPPRPRSAEAEMGRRAYDEYFGDRAGAYREGQDQAVRDRIREDIRRHESDRNRIMIQARGQLRHPKNKAQLEEFQRLKREIDALETELNRLDNVYWNLYVEVDARGAQADLLREVADTARRIALEQRFKDATDGLDRLRGNAEAGDQAALTNLVAAMRNYQREMEKMRLSLPKPPAPATTGGGDGGGSK